MRRLAAGRGTIVLLVLLGLLGVLGLTGCGAVEVAVPPLATSAPCPSMGWPQQVAGHDRVDVTPDSPASAAWGDPAIIARCGVPAPPPTTLECLGVDDVDWVVEQLSDGQRFTTYGRDPALQVLVPNAYSPEPLVLGAFTPAARTLPATGRQCR